MISIKTKRSMSSPYFLFLPWCSANTACAPPIELLVRQTNRCFTAKICLITPRRGRFSKYWPLCHGLPSYYRRPSRCSLSAPCWYRINCFDIRDADPLLLDSAGSGLFSHLNTTLMSNLSAMGLNPFETKEFSFWLGLEHY